jgi:hypothetical protein
VRRWDRAFAEELKQKFEMKELPWIGSGVGEMPIGRVTGLYVVFEGDVRRIAEANGAEFGVVSDRFVLEYFGRKGLSAAEVDQMLNYVADRRAVVPAGLAKSGKYEGVMIGGVLFAEMKQ